MLFFVVNLDLLHTMQQEASSTQITQSYRNVDSLCWPSYRKNGKNHNLVCLKLHKATSHSKDKCVMNFSNLSIERLKVRNSPLYLLHK